MKSLKRPSGKITYTLFFFISILLFASCDSQENKKAQKGQNQKDSIENLVSKGIDNNESVGLSVMIHENGKDKYLSNGYANLETKKVIDEKTQFEIGSITKTFIALLIVIAEEEGKISIDDPIENFFPQNTKLPKFGNSKITIKNLLVHNSGIPYKPSNIDSKNESEHYLKYTEKELFYYLENLTLKNEPGKAYEYSLTGYGILGYILENLYSKSLDDLIKEKITIPLGMTRTFINYCDKKDNNYADGYLKGVITNWCRNDYCVLNASGALCSTAEDLMIFMKAQAGAIETPLNKAMLKTQEFQYKGNDYDVCLGWFKTNEFIFHSGATNGFFAIAVFNSESKKILLMLSNTNNQKWITGVAMKEMGFHK
jgi:CubicO group peptidase (beta-lactamase class C family)